MTYIAVNDTLPPDDFHTWARPVGEDCPHCKCCTAALCKRAIERDTACHWEGRSPDYRLAECPCWRQGSVARQASAAVGADDPPIDPERSRWADELLRKENAGVTDSWRESD